MRARVVVGSVVATVAVLVVGWTVGRPATVLATPTSKLTDGTYSGTSETTQFGDVQVGITVSGGRITEVTALHLTDAEQRSVEISNQAAPILREEVLKAQSASVAAVSGATYTTDAYLSSLQSAIDKAKA